MAEKRTRLLKDGFRLLCWLPVGIFFERHVYSLASISGASMQPTFNPSHASNPLHHDVVLLDRWSVALNIYRKGDVVTLISPQNPKLLTTKRIVALEGDLVKPLPPSPPTPVRVPPGHCWVEGDSHYHSRDSNTYGPDSLPPESHISSGHSIELVRSVKEVRTKVGYEDFRYRPPS